MKECDSSHHLLDVVAYLLLVVTECLHEFLVGDAACLLLPFASAFDESFAGDVLNEIGVLLAVFVEELVGERFYGEGFLEVLE